MKIVAVWTSEKHFPLFVSLTLVLYEFVDEFVGSGRKNFHSAQNPGAAYRFDLFGPLRLFVSITFWWKVLREVFQNSKRGI